MTPSYRVWRRTDINGPYEGNSPHAAEDSAPVTRQEGLRARRSMLCIWCSAGIS